MSSTASEGGGLDALLTDVVAGRACERARGQFFPLRGQGTDAPVTGRLWLERCAASLEPRTVEARTEARGWRWVDRSMEKLAATLTVDEYAKFGAVVTVVASVDGYYDADHHQGVIWITPSEPLAVRARALGQMRVATPGLWSSLVGFGAWAVPTVDLDERAERRLEGRLSQTIERRLDHGLTVVADLCTGARTTRIGRIDRDRSLGPLIAEANAKSKKLEQVVALRPSGIDLAGPLPSGRETRGWTISVELQQGPAIRSQVVCRSEAERIANAFLSGEPTPQAQAKARLVLRVVGSQTVTVTPACPLVIFTEPLGGSDGVSRFRVTAERQAPDSGGLVSCQEEDRPNG